MSKGKEDWQKKQHRNNENNDNRHSHSQAPLEFISTYGTLPVMGFPLNHECGQGHQVPQGSIAKGQSILNSEHLQMLLRCFNSTVFHLCQPRAIFQTIWHRWKNAPGNVLGNARDLAASEQLSICSQIVIEMEMLNLVKYQCTSFHITPLGVWGVRPGITQNNIPMAVTTTTTFSNMKTQTSLQI